MEAVTKTDREADIQKVCLHIITMSPESTGDYGSGAQCPFCYADCSWNEDDLKNVEHKSDCIYLIAKDLTTNIS